MNYKQIILYFIYANFFITVCASVLNLDRPIFNLDYLLLLIFCYLPKNFVSYFIFCGAYLFLYTLDLLLLALQKFPFVGFTDVIYLSGFIFNGPILYREIIILTLLANFLLSFFIIRDYFFKRINLDIKQFMIILLAILSIIFFNYNFTLISSKKNLHSLSPKKLINSQILFFVKNKSSSFVETLQYKGTKLQELQFSQATRPLFIQIRANQSLSSKILIVVNESWG